MNPLLVNGDSYMQNFTVKTAKTATSLKAFMSGLIDYAGLFPPANLPLDQAIKNYVHYRESDQRWMLSRFIVPASRLEEVSTQDLFRQSAEPFHFSVIGHSGKENFLASAVKNLHAVSAFRQRHGTAVTADVFEVPLPIAILFESRPRAWAVLATIHSQLETVGGIRTYFEVPAGPAWLEMMSRLVDTIAEFNLARGTDMGFKLRCGGVKATDFPPSTKLAMALLRCRDAGIALKATAGLHHPIRRFDRSVQTTMHGFLNVFGAGILAYVHRLDAATTRAILDDENADNFRFTDAAFSWHDFVASADQITTVRQKALISYGSCSFEEPYQDLQAMGVM